MDAPAALDIKKLDWPALQSVALCFLVIAVSMMSMVKSAHASGTVTPGSLASTGNCINIPVVNANYDAFLACVVADKGAVSAGINWVGQCGGCDVYVVFADKYTGHCPWTNGCLIGYSITYSIGCPAHSLTSGNSCTCINPYEPDASGKICIIPACPLHAKRNPPDAPCACEPGYEFDAAGTGCVSKQYILELTIKPADKVEPSGSATVTATVKDAQGKGKSGVTVSLKVDVEAGSGGHDHDAGRHVSPYTGTLSAATGTTGPDGAVSFTFGAPEVSGTHTFTAKCISPSCANEGKAKINVKVDGLVPIPEEPEIYNLITKNMHSDNHYLTGNAINQLVVLAINYHHLYPKDPVLHLNDASLVWGGKFDINGNWVGDHGAHRRGTVIDIRANTALGNIPERLFTDFEKLADGTKQADGITSANAELHCSTGRDPSVDNCVDDDNRHYHVLLLGVDQ